MIIQRKHTRNYTVMNREVFQDERLSPEALGVLCFLRHLPDDWTVSQEHLRSRFKVGRDKMQRIIRELTEAGWMKRVTARTGGRGTFAGSDYVVNDEPALTTVATLQQPENPVAVPQPGLPESGKPQPVEPAPEKPAAYLELSLPSRESPPFIPPSGGTNTARKLLRGNGIAAPVAPQPAANRPGKARLEPAAAERFGRLWAAYPPAGLGHSDRARAEGTFAQLTEADQEHTIVAARAYVAELARSRLQAKALQSWLRQRRFTNFAVAAPAGAPSASTRVFVTEDSPAWNAWQAHIQATGGRRSPVTDHGAQRGWWFPSELPPAQAA